MSKHPTEGEQRLAVQAYCVQHRPDNEGFVLPAAQQVIFNHMAHCRKCSKNLDRFMAEHFTDEIQMLGKDIRNLYGEEALQQMLTDSPSLKRLIDGEL